MSRPWAMFAAAICLAAAGCGSDSLSLARRNPGDEPTLSRTDAGTTIIPPDPNVIHDVRIREDFNSRFYVDTASTAILDVNRGQVSLPAEVFPRPTGSNVPAVTNLDRYEGLVEARAIIVRAGAMVEGHDTVELRAEEEVRITGRILAGPGGVNITAGRAIRIDGVVESAGPIRLRVADDDGVVEISGRAATLSTNRSASAPIDILARGAVRITGEVVTGNAEYADTGAIVIGSYGKITIAGAATAVRTGTSLAGHTGRIDLSTETSILVEDGAAISGGDSIPENARPARTNAGEVALRAVDVELGESARITGGAAASGRGGVVRIQAAGTFASRLYSSISGGDGDFGGEVMIDGQQLSVGPSATARGGVGRQAAGRVFLASAGNTDLEAEVHAIGGDGGCALGGAVVIHAGGLLTMLDTVELRGGKGGAEADCIGTYPGGDVLITARQIDGPVDAIAWPGTGMPMGKQQIRADPSFHRDAPEIRVRTTGWVISKRIDRGESARQLRPRLVEARIDTPAGTFAKIQLQEVSGDACAADGPWIDASLEQLELLEPLIGARELCYRVWLRGRALDTPIVDGFEIDLAPR